MTLPAHSAQSPFSVAMFRALNDLRQGPAFTQPSTLFQGVQPGRMFIRSRTLRSLRERGFVAIEEIARGIDQAAITDEGRAYLLRHVVYRDLQAA